MQRGFCAKGEGIVVEESHDQAAIHGIDLRRAILRASDLLDLHLLEHELGRERSLGDSDRLNALLFSAEGSEVELVKVPVGADADAFQGGLKLLQIFGE